MAYTETTTTSYGGRIGKALQGVVGGFIAFVAGTALLVWNEGNFVKTRKALLEAEGATVVVEDISRVDPELNGKLIHASGFADTQDILEDAAFGVKERAISLHRAVEFYQYQEKSKTEKRDKVGGGEERITTYTYHLDWQTTPIDSKNFKDPDYQNRNFTLYASEAQQQYARNVSFGAYQLPDFFIEAISGEEAAAVNLTEDQLQALNRQIGRHPRVDPEDRETSRVHVRNNVVYFGTSPDSPKVGDVRVTLTRILPKDVSLIGKVNGSTFGRFVAKNNKRVSRLETGIVSAEEMFSHAQSENRMLTWILRLVGVVLVCGGLRGIFGVLEAIAKVLPVLGDIVGAGVGLVCTIFGMAWSLTWIALAWVAWRPLVGVPLLAASVALVVWLSKKGKRA